MNVHKQISIMIFGGALLVSSQGCALQQAPKKQILAMSQTSLKNLNAADASALMRKYTDQKRRKSFDVTLSGRERKVDPRSYTAHKRMQQTPFEFISKDSAPLALPISVGVLFNGISKVDGFFDGLQPNSNGAIGCGQYIETTPYGIRSHDRITGKPDDILDVSPGSFFNINAVEPLVDVNFPFIQFDIFEKRWYIAASSVAIPSYLLLGVSDSAQISTSTHWDIHVFRTDLVNPLGDEGFAFRLQSFGLDAEALYFGGQMDNAEPATSLGAIQTSVFVIQKKSLFEEGPVVINAFRDLIDKVAQVGIFSPQAAYNFDKKVEAGYVIGVDLFVFGKIIFHRILNPGSKCPTISPRVELFVPLFVDPANAPHKGNLAPCPVDIDIEPVGCIFTLDSRLQAAHVRNKQLFTCQTTLVDSDGNGAFPPPSGAGDRDGARFYQFDVVPATPALVQYATLFDHDKHTKSPNYFYYPSVMTNRKGTLTMSCQTSSAKAFVNAVTAFRLAGDPLNTLRPQVIKLTNSDSSYNAEGALVGKPLRNWGIYSNTSLDPQDQTSMWTMQPYVNTTDSFINIIAELVDNS